MFSEVAAFGTPIIQETQEVRSRSGRRRIGNKWQQMAAFWQHPGSGIAADWQLLAAALAAKGRRMAAKWQQMAAAIAGHP
jgi:hypothetical protein